jgi:energy-coupling factor transporter ATP-binding protein EcfA2
VSPAVEQILARLRELGFSIRTGRLAPFGERIPLVSGIAWDARTAQLALVAETGREASADEWRQLLFAGSALRHHLVDDGSAAFGTPVILAVVDDDGRHRLRELAEDLAQRYVIFNRVDLNLVLRSDLTDPDRLDDALAPLLPRCREALGQEISKDEVKRFWKALEDEVMRAAAGLDSVFSAHREAAGQEAATALVGESASAPDLPSPWPLDRLRLRNFRSIGEADFALSPITIIHGPNGGGKSTLLEGLELVWAGTSQRKPATVPAGEYARHLPRNGVGEFEVAGDGGEVVTDVADEARAELGRCILTHEAVEALVSQSPEDRYSALLATTGLEIPDLAARTAALLDDAKQSADQALRRAGLPPLPRRDSQGERHLRNALRANFAGRLPSSHDLAGAEEALAAASAGGYRPRQWPTDQHAAAALVQADGLIARLLGASPELDAVGAALDDAEVKVQSLAGPLRDAAQAVRVLLAAIERPEDESPTPEQEAIPPPRPATVPPDLAARWLAHANSLRDAAARFRTDAESLRDVDWAKRLQNYADALDAAADAAPTKALVPLAQATPISLQRRRRPPVRDELFRAAGFSAPPAAPEPLVAPLREFLTVLQRQVEALETLARELQRHPARGFSQHAEPVLEAICRFELARGLRRAGPILKASEQLVADLLKGRLAPVVRELVAAIVRFEWYFKPLLIPDAGRKVVLGGLATPDEKLDARLVLNSAERTALGLAWFMALHLLQPPERRRVLVMDDPASVFDSANQAGFTSTLRAFARLTRPEQVVVAVHDDAVAAVLAEELAPVDGWPAAVTRVRCQRDPMDFSVVSAEWTSEESRSIAEEADRLRLRDEAPAPDLSTRG